MQLITFYSPCSLPMGKEPVIKTRCSERGWHCRRMAGYFPSVGLQTTGELPAYGIMFFTHFFSNGQVYFGPKFPTEGLDELNSRIRPELQQQGLGNLYIQ